MTDDNFEEGKSFKVHDITISSLCREHKHSDIEAGLDSYTSNWELLEEKRQTRGTVRTYIVQDQYHVEVSRTGTALSGNTVSFSKNCPEELIRRVCFTLFEKIFERKIGDLSSGETNNKISVKDNEVTIITPRSFILKKECTEKEIEEYYDEIGKHLYELVEKYKNTKTTQDLQEIINWYKSKKEQTYEKYTKN